MAKRYLIPSDAMVPIGACATKEFGTCADSWSDSQIAVLRARLDMQYHAVPLDEMRRQFINIRKKGTDGYRVNGTGPAKGSRKKPNKKDLPPSYRAFIESPLWKKKKEKWIEAWGRRCSVCNGSREGGFLLDVHHRTYERFGGRETFYDCIVLCRGCHDVFHDNSSIHTESSGGLF